jgi:polyphosphate kinase
MWDDNVKTRVLGADGIYQRVDRRGRASLDAQDFFATQATQLTIANKEKMQQNSPNQFQPMMSPENQHEPFSD